MRIHISDTHKLLKSTHLFPQNTVLPHVPTWIKCKHTKIPVWGAKHSLSLMTWLWYPTNKAPGQTEVCMVEKFQGSRDHWRITHGRECRQSVQCSYLSDWQSSKSLWHTCTMPFYTTLFPKTTKHQCESCWIISKDMFETADDESGIFNRNTKVINMVLQ